MASSSDEGEIIEKGHGDLKATSLPRNAAEVNGVDRRDRNPKRFASPDVDNAQWGSDHSRRSRSPPRGNERSRLSYNQPRRKPGRFASPDIDNDSWGSDHSRRSRSPPRGNKRSRLSYDQPRGTGRDYESKYARRRYDDLDRPPSRGSHFDYHARERERDRDRLRDRDYRDRGYERQGTYSDKRQRNRSPSPYWSGASDKSRAGHLAQEGRYARDAPSDPRYDEQNPKPSGSTSTKTSPSENPSVSVGLKVSAQPGLSTATEAKGTPREPQNNTEAAAEPNMEYEEPEAFDEDAEIERRRKRREEILAKSSSATPLLLHAVGATDKMSAASPFSSQLGASQLTESDASQTPRLSTPQSPATNDAPSEGQPDAATRTDSTDLHADMSVDDDNGPSAASYDPTVDMQEDERRDKLRHGQIIVHGKPQLVETVEQKAVDLMQPVESSTEAANGTADDDDDFDMFAEDFDEEKFAVQTSAGNAPPGELGDVIQASGQGAILEGDDKDGYYKIRIGEILCGRYQVQATLGKGMFSGVVRALDMTTKKVIAIKMMRNNDALRKGGYTEIAILEKLNKNDPEDRCHIIKFEHSFDFKGHLCMAFENLNVNLRELLRKYGNNVGISLLSVRSFAWQIFTGLAHMQRCSIIHADLKPDNILVSESYSNIKICDLGTAIDRSDAATAHTTITPYLVSRFYRAPEVILGMPYDYGVDVWSIGCTLYELYTGKVLFAGDSNNQMLKTIMEVRGRISPKLYRRGQLSSQHWNEAGQFRSVEYDKILGTTTVRTLSINKPIRDLRSRLTAAYEGTTDAELVEFNAFVDLLEACLTLNPDKRIKAADALKHPLFTNKRR